MSEDPIHISSVALQVREQFGNPVYCIKFKTKTGGFAKEILWEFPPGYEHHEVFDPPLKLSARDQLIVSVQSQSGCYCCRTVCINVKQSEIVRHRSPAEGNRRNTYVTVRKNLVVTISLLEDPTENEGGPNAESNSAAVAVPDVSSPVTGEMSGDTMPSSLNGNPEDVTPSLAPDGKPNDALPAPNDALPPSIVIQSHDDSSLSPSTAQDTNVRSPHTTNGGADSDTSHPVGEFSYVDPESPIVIEGPHLNHLSTTSDILRICPRFRLLIIGNSGVGKTTLVRSVFGVKDVDVSDASRGRADIEHEFISPDNGLFVVHDSLGLEAAERNHFTLIKDFIASRRKQEKLKDRLHAVWVCVPVPYAGGRVLEAGLEEFLRNKKEILGNIPVVVVITKLDLLDKLLITKLRNEGVQFKSIDEARPRLQPQRSAFLAEHCAKPLVKAGGDDISHVAVSTKSGYNLEPTIPELVRKTTSEIERYIRADPSFVAEAGHLSEQNAQLYVAEMAQRASIQAKVDLTIETGKKGYWSNLGAIVDFSDKKMEECLLGLHRDIIQVWNFNDPEGALQGSGFMKALLDLSDLGVDMPHAKTSQSSTGFSSVMQLLLNDPAAIVLALPFAGAMALVKAAIQVKKAAKTIVKCFMAYIVDLINVLKILFILAPGGSVTSADVAHAMDVYKKSSFRDSVHTELKEFNTGFAALGRDVIIDKIETLIRRYDVTDEELSQWRAQLQAAMAASRRQ